MHNVGTKGEILERGVESNARKEGRKGGSEGKEGTLLKIIQVIMKHYPFDVMWGSM
jgi:hypothetical protein